MAHHTSDDDLCAEVAAALKARVASWAERHMAVVAAAMRRRYESIVTAMEPANLEPIVIEDLVKFGEDRGRLDEERSTLRRLLALRRLVIGADGERHVEAGSDLATLRRWYDQAIFVAIPADVFR